MHLGEIAAATDIERIGRAMVELEKLADAADEAAMQAARLGDVGKARRYERVRDARWDEYEALLTSLSVTPAKSPSDGLTLIAAARGLFSTMRASARPEGGWNEEVALLRMLSEAERALAAAGHGTPLPSPYGPYSIEQQVSSANLVG